MKNVVAILGYNNTRIGDIKYLRSICSSSFDMEILLCKEHLSDDDKSVVQYCIDVKLSSDMVNISLVLSYCQETNITIKSVLAFSDQGNLLAASLAYHLGLPAADFNKISAAVSKSDFRKLELAFDMPVYYKKIGHNVVSSIEELYILFDEKKQIFIKPSQEGNSRGCSVIRKRDEIENAWQNVMPYIDGGVIVEDFISGIEEFSCDHVGEFTWVTAKETSLNEFRVEIQQIVPANLDIETTNKLIGCGHKMANICGTNFHCFHNELFYQQSTKFIFGVEPNIRPAGMQIWNLAMIAYKDFNPWIEWINSSLEIPRYPIKNSKTIFQEYFAGIRMIKANNDGKIIQLPVIELPEEIIELVWTKKAGDVVSCAPRDNSQFVGYIIGKSKIYHDLSKILLEVQTKISNLLEIC